MNARDKARQAARNKVMDHTGHAEIGADAASEVWELIVKDVINVLVFTKTRLEKMQMGTRELDALLMDLRAAVRRG